MRSPLNSKGNSFPFQKETSHLQKIYLFLRKIWRGLFQNLKENQKFSYAILAYNNSILLYQQPSP